MKVCLAVADSLVERFSTEGARDKEVAVTATDLLHHVFPWEIAPGVARDAEPFARDDVWTGEAA